MTEIQAGTCHATCHPESPSTKAQSENKAMRDQSAKTERKTPDYNVDRDTLFIVLMHKIHVHCYCCALFYLCAAQL